MQNGWHFGSTAVHARRQPLVAPAPVAPKFRERRLRVEAVRVTARWCSSLNSARLSEIQAGYPPNELFESVEYDDGGDEAFLRHRQRDLDGDASPDAPDAPSV